MDARPECLCRWAAGEVQGGDEAVQPGTQRRDPHVTQPVRHPLRPGASLWFRSRGACPPSTSCLAAAGRNDDMRMSRSRHTFSAVPIHAASAREKGALPLNPQLHTSITAVLRSAGLSRSHLPAYRHTAHELTLHIIRDARHAAQQTPRMTRATVPDRFSFSLWRKNSTVSAAATDSTLGPSTQEISL